MRCSRTSQRVLVTVLVWVAVLASLSLASTTKALAQEGEEEKPKPLRLMPRVGLEIEYGGFFFRGEDFTSAFRYHFLIDVLRLRRHLIFIDIDGEITFGIPNESLAFNRLRHRMAMVGYRYDLGNHYIGIHYSHRCNNPFLERGRLQNTFDRNLSSIYFLGIELVDRALLAGQRDRGINFDSQQPFEWLARWHFAFSFNRMVSTYFADVDWLFTSRVRLDILRYRRLVPYVEAGGELLVWSKWRFVPKVEAGVRFHAGYLEFTPFLQWGRTQEWLQIRGTADSARFLSRSYLLGGGRLAFALDQETLSRPRSSERLQLFPEVHGLAAYGLYPGSRFHRSKGHVELHLDLLRCRSVTLFTHLGLMFNTFREGFGPDKIKIWAEYGLRYSWDRFFLEAFMRDARRLDAVTFRGLRESAHQAGGRVGTRGMLLGHYDDDISFTGPRFQWLNKFNAQASFSHYYDNQEWPFLWNLETKARWDVLRWRFVVPYLQGGVEWLSAYRGVKDALGYYLEPGLRLHGTMDLAIFYRFQHQETLFSFRGPTENMNLIGIRALF